MAAGAAGINRVKVNDRGERLPQLANAVTLIAPDVNDAKFTSTLVVPCPLTIVAPVGTVHK